MNKTQIGLGVVLLDFSIFTAYVVYQYGYVSFFQQALANAVSAQIFIDLCIALTMVIAWMWRDARARGISPIPFVVLTLTLGSIGPLAYLVRRASTSAAATLPLTPARFADAS